MGDQPCARSGQQRPPRSPGSPPPRYWGLTTPRSSRSPGGPPPGYRGTPPQKVGSMHMGRSGVGPARREHPGNQVHMQFPPHVWEPPPPSRLRVPFKPEGTGDPANYCRGEAAQTRRGTRVPKGPQMHPGPRPPPTGRPNPPNHCKSHVHIIVSHMNTSETHKTTSMKYAHPRNPQGAPVATESPPAPCHADTPRENPAV